MAKWTNDGAMDAALAFITSNADRLIVCTSQPLTYADAVTNVGSGGYKLADIAVDPSDFVGPVTGTIDGRKVTVQQQTDIPVDATGDCLHVCLVEDTVGNQRILHITTCPQQTLTAGNTVTVPAYEIEFGAPTNP